MSELPDVLIVTHRVPFPPDKGDRIRTYHLLKWLSGRARIHLAALADESVSPEATSVLTGLCSRFAAIPMDRFARIRGLRSLSFGANALVIAFPLLAARFPSELTGRVNTSINVLAFSCAFFLQWGIGLVVNLWPVHTGGYSAAGYFAAWAALLALQTIAFVRLAVSTRGGGNGGAHGGACSP